MPTFSCAACNGKVESQSDQLWCTGYTGKHHPITEMYIVKMSASQPTKGREKYGRTSGKTKAK